MSGYRERLPVCGRILDCTLVCGRPALRRPRRSSGIALRPSVL